MVDGYELHDRAEADRNATRRPRGATQSQASAIPARTTSAAPIFASKPSPTQTPAATSHLVAPCSSARTKHQSAPALHGTGKVAAVLVVLIPVATAIPALLTPAITTALLGLLVAREHAGCDERRDRLRARNTMTEAEAELLGEEEQEPAPAFG